MSQIARFSVVFIILRMKINYIQFLKIYLSLIFRFLTETRTGTQGSCLIQIRQQFHDINSGFHEKLIKSGSWISGSGQIPEELFPS